MRVWIAVFLMFAVCPVLPAGASTECFAPYQKIDTIVGAWNLRVADFNHDGIPDVAVVGLNTEFPSYTGILSIFLGQGDGTFLPTIKYEAVFGASGLAVGDFDSDGNQDILVVSSFPAESGGGAEMFLGKGDGTFRRGSIGLHNSAAREMNTAEAGDFNGDGKLDAVITPFFARHVITVIGNGDGTLDGPFRIEPGSWRPYNVIVADFNRDGKLDLAVINAASANSRKILMIYLGRGDGSFDINHGYSVRTGVATGGVAGDFNEDGKIDIAVALGHQVAIFLGKGDGTFRNAVPYDATTGSLVAADFTGDKHLDLVGLGTEGRGQERPFLSVQAGNGDGTFRPAARMYNVPDGAIYMAVGDLNLDGRPDLAIVPVTGPDEGLTVELNTGKCQ